MSSAPQAPLFVREVSLPVRFGLYVLLGLFVAAVDTRYATLNEVRAGLNTVLQPLRAGLAMPWDWARDARDFFFTHGELKTLNAQLNQEHKNLLVLQQDRLALAAENQNLRRLLTLPERPGVVAQAVEIIEVMADPFSRKVMISKGSNQGIVAGRPVVDSTGLLGQVTRVFPLTAEVTLLTDADQAAPVQNLRNGLRIIVSGTGADNLLEVRFLDMHADIKPGDWLYTSGIDGVYPAGIPVAQVEKTEPPRNTPFAKALCRPIGGIGRYRHASVLQLVAPALASAPPSPTPTPPASAR